MDKPRKFIDIVIPFNNEYLNLQILLPKTLKVLKKIKYFKFRVILIDDGSIDKGHLLVNKFKKKYKNIFLLKNRIKSGQTYSYINYLKNFKTDYFIRIDADNQDDPKHFANLAHSAGVKDQVIFLGSRDDVDELMVFSELGIYFYQEAPLTRL